MLGDDGGDASGIPASHSFGWPTLPLAVASGRLCTHPRAHGPDVLTRPCTVTHTHAYENACTHSRTHRYGVRFLRFCKRATLQFCATKVIAATVTIILVAQAVYDDGSLSPKHGYL